MDTTDRPPSYRKGTWEKVSGRLSGLGKAELASLAKRMGVELAPTEAELYEALVSRGGLLLVEFGLVGNPEIMRRTIFSHGGIEYVIDEKAAQVLARRDGTTRVKRLGSSQSRLFSYAELLQALVESPDFDQLGA